MKPTYKYVLSVLFLINGLVAQAAEFSLPKYEKIILENGLTVFLLEQKEVPLVDILMVVKTGAINDTHSGLAQVTAENLLLGTKRLDRTSFEQKLDFVGATIRSNAGLESTSIAASLASKDIDLVLPLLRDAVIFPAFDKAEFDNQKERYLAALTRKKESPKAKINDYFNALLYEGHTYSNSVDGNEFSVNALNLKQILEFHHNWYTPANSAIVVSGDIRSQDMAAKLKQLFGAWQGSSKELQIAPLPKLKRSQVLLVNKSDATESTFMIGGPGIKRSNPDFVAITVINTILGGRFTSWLNDELRVNSGLSYGARSRFDAKIAGGSFYISTFTKTATTVDAIDLTLKTYSRLWETGIDINTLESAKAYVKGQFPPKYETSSALANLLGNMYVYGFDERFIDTFSEQVNQLDISKAEHIIKKYFPKEHLQFVVIGKAEDIREHLKKYGQLQEVEIEDD
jgi:predicted Zn-dependent peptidase